jgi:aryl-alcohol dehydrogenase-like predicted oxidoreductase
MALTEYITLGRSGLRVSPFCLGTMTFGTEWGWGSEVEDSVRILDAYIERGGNFLDTANMYTKGHSEQVIGDHIGKHSSVRDRIVMATKFMGAMHLGDPNSGGAGRKAVLDQCDESLRRLQTDYIDLYWLHFWDHHTPIEETLRALDDLVTSGKVRYVGFSDVPAWVCAHAQTLCDFKDYAPIIALQIEYSLIERSVEDELLPMARAMGMGVTPWSPLKGGILTGKYTRDSIPPADERRYHEDSRYLSEKTFAIVDELTAIGAELNATPAQIALAWVQAQPGVESTIIGARTMKQLEVNLGALDILLTESHLDRLDEVSKREPIFPHGFLPNVARIFAGGAAINGEHHEAWDMAPQNDDERW